MGKAVGGFLGGLLGPVGAIIGSIVGGIGAVVGKIPLPGIGSVGNAVGAVGEAVGGTQVAIGGNTIGTIGEIAGNAGAAIPGIVSDATAIAIDTGAADMINNNLIKPNLPPPNPVTPTPPATPTPNPEPPAETPPEVIEEPGAAPNLSDSRYANDPTAQFQEAVKKRRLAMLRKGMLDTIRTGPGGVAGSPALLVPAASGGGLKTKLGA